MKKYIYKNKKTNRTLTLDKPISEVLIMGKHITNTEEYVLVSQVKDMNITSVRDIKQK